MKQPTKQDCEKILDVVFIPLPELSKSDLSFNRDQLSRSYIEAPKADRPERYDEPPEKKDL